MGFSRQECWSGVPLPSPLVAALGWLRANTEAPVNQSGPKGEEVKVTGEKAEESALQCYGGGGGQGTMVCPCFASTTTCLTRCTEVVLLGADAPVA